MTDWASLETALGHHFAKPELLRLALTHPSVAQNTKASIEHNQRLEFLGDAVLQLALTFELYQKFPDVDEGSLTKARAQLVNQSALAGQARQLELGRFVVLSHGEEQNGGRERESTLADAMEAVLGAIFLDAGFEVARELIVRQFRELFGELEVVPNLGNPKGELQERLQAQSKEGVEYELLAVTGPDHNREFECRVSHQGQELGRGKGRSKKAAESEAALEALNRMQRTEEADESTAR